jgi:hypothetical protein
MWRRRWRRADFLSSAKSCGQSQPDAKPAPRGCRWARLPDGGEPQHVAAVVLQADAIQQSLVIRVLKNTSTQVAGKLCFDPLHPVFVGGHRPACARAEYFPAAVLSASFQIGGPAHVSLLPPCRSFELDATSTSAAPPGSVPRHRSSSPDPSPSRPHSLMELIPGPLRCGAEDGSGRRFPYRFQKPSTAPVPLPCATPCRRYARPAPFVPTPAVVRMPGLRRLPPVSWRLESVRCDRLHRASRYLFTPRAGKKQSIEHRLHSNAHFG